MCTDLFLIDGKNCENAENIEDLGHNAFSVQWSPSKGPAKVGTRNHVFSIDVRHLPLFHSLSSVLTV